MRPAALTRPSRLLAALVAALVVAALALGVTGCGSDDAAPTGPLTQEGRSRALAAAVIDAVDGPAGTAPSAAAPIFPRDELLPRGGIGVEVVFPRSGEDSLHVRLVVARADDPDYAPTDCGPSVARLGCEQQDVDGVPTVLKWDAGYPEEDPGGISAVGVHDDRIVTARAFGPFVEPGLADLRDVADALVELVADPDVGSEPSADLVEEGASIGDDVWLDWYGQGNGYPAPPGFDPDARVSAG